MPKVKRLLLFAVFCALLSLLPAAGWCAGTTTVSSEPTVTMSLRQYETLKASIETLKANSKTREQLINEQSKQISELKKQLTISQTQMQNSRISMDQTQKQLTQQSESLKMLTQQINDQSHKYRIAKQQRDTWAVAAGVLLVGLAVK